MIQDRQEGWAASGRFLPASHVGGMSISLRLQLSFSERTSQYSSPVTLVKSRRCVRMHCLLQQQRRVWAPSFLALYLTSHVKSDAWFVFPPPFHPPITETERDHRRMTSALEGEVGAPKED